jgi:hypothetical protein
MKRYEHCTIEFRGYSLREEDQSKLAELGRDGFAIVAAFAVPDGAGVTAFTFVLSREIVEEGDERSWPEIVEEMASAVAAKLPAVEQPKKGKGR